MRLNRPSIVAIAGFCIFVLGLLCSSFIFPKLQNFLIAKATKLEEGSKTFESWKKIPFAFKLKIYFFNVSNPDEVGMGSKPILKEMGPYIYDEFREREILTIDEENDTIKYIERKHYYFNQEESGCRSDDDIVTILHFGIVSMAHKVNSISPMALPMLEDALPFLFPNIKNAFVTNTVRNILFDGLKIMCNSEEADMICDGLRSKSTHTIRPAENGTAFLLSVFYHQNGTDDGPYEIGRGQKNTIKGKIVSFKGNNSLPQWGTTHCSEIHGTDLTINPNLLEIPEKISFFAPDFCRSFTVQFRKETDYLGLGTYFFKTPNLFRTSDATRRCFCTKTLPKCFPEGTMDVSPCTGSPIVISQPHFLHADRSLLEFGQGLKPSYDKHGTFIILEPKTGVVLNVKTRFQMNVFLKSYAAVGVLSNVSEGLFPFMWLEKGADVPMTIVEELRDSFNKLRVLDVLKYLLIVGGVVLLGVSLILAMIKDKIICLCSKNNAVAVKGGGQIARFMDLYPDLKMNSGEVPQADNGIGRNVWKITH